MERSQWMHHFSFWLDSDRCPWRAVITSLVEFALSLCGVTSRDTRPKKKKHGLFLCFCACPGVILDIREGQPRPPSD